MPLWVYYNRMLKQYPIISSAIQTSFLMGMGDGIAQKIVDRKSEYNYLRMAQFASVGLFVTGPMLAVWYKILARHIGTEGKVVALKKLAVDQLCFAPSALVVFLTSLGIVQGHNKKDIVQGIKRDYKDILLNNYKVWPFVLLINFYVVPLQFQVLYVQCVAVVWNAYLSWKTLSDKKI